MDKYNFNVPLLIESVKARPCIWDKLNSAFKDRIERQKAWQEICEILKVDYDTMNSDEQKQLSDAVVKKWNHVRDAFIRSTKRRRGNSSLRKYLYHRRLQFLVRSMNDKEEKTDGNSDVYPTVTVKEEISEDDEVRQLAGPSNANSSFVENGASPHSDRSGMDLPMIREVFESPCKIRKLDDDSTVILSHSGQGIKTPDEDEAFFISIMSSVKRLTDNEKLDFKIGVLNLIRNIKKKQ